MKNQLFIICIDSLRFNYLNQVKSLNESLKTSQFGRLKTILGYSGIGATFLTGKMPQEHNIWTEFYHRNNSGLAFFKNANFLENSFLEKPIRLAINFYLNLLRLVAGKNYFHKIQQIPLAKLGQFKTALVDNWICTHYVSGDSYFEILRKKQIPFLAIDWPLLINNRGFSIIPFYRNNDQTKTKLFFKKIDKAQVIWLRLWDLDTASHRYGIRSTQFKEAIDRLDDFIVSLMSQVKQRKADYLLWSDHGMVKVTKRIDINKAVSGLNLDYFLDSTLARFWFKDRQAKEKLEKVLAQFKKDGHILTDKERKIYQLNFMDNRYGDLVFLVNPGVLIYPNFYQKNKPVLAMHGYDPSYPDQFGMYITSLGKGRQDLEMKDMFPILKKWLNKA